MHVHRVMQVQGSCVTVGGVDLGRVTGDVPCTRGERMWMTCSADRHDHVVDEQLLAHGSGYFPAVCGHLVLAASLVEPPGAACPTCLAATRAPDRTRRRGGRHAAH